MSIREDCVEGHELELGLEGWASVCSMNGMEIEVGHRAPHEEEVSRIQEMAR